MANDHNPQNRGSELELNSWWISKRNKISHRCLDHGWGTTHPDLNIRQPAQGSGFESFPWIQTQHHHSTLLEDKRRSKGRQNGFTRQEKPFWGGGGDFGWGGSGPDSKDYSSEEEVPTRARALRSQPTVPTRARALRSQPTEFDFSGDNLEEIRQKIRTEREAIKDAIAVGSKRMLTIGICSASLLDVMFDDFPTSHTPIEREKLERSYRERVEKKLGFVPNFDKVLSRLSRGLILPHKINMKEVKVGGKEMLEASIVTKKESVPTQDWLALMRRLQPLSTKLAALEARAVELERSLPPPEPPKGGA